MDPKEIAQMAEVLYPSVMSLLKQIWMPGDWFQLDERVASHYAVKAAVCRIAAQQVTGGAMSIIEIGTRCGYSAAVFRQAAPFSRMLCFDGGLDQDSDRCLAWGDRVMLIADVDAAIVRVDTANVASITAAGFAHVDGDHSFDGCLRDLRLCSGCPVILADDADNREVHAAVSRFIQESGRPVTWISDGLRNAAVIE